VEFISEIIYQLGIPNNIITNNGTQFIVREFRDFYKNAGIKVNYASFCTYRATNKSNGPIV
jgi:hypothetical protein